MNIKTKAVLYAFSIFFVIFLVVWFIVSYFFKDLTTPWIGAITAAISSVLAPQRKIVKTQSGEQVQLKSIFSKKAIIIK